MTETIMAMMDLIPTATLFQFAELSALLETEKSPPPETAQPPPPPPPLPALAKPPSIDAPGLVVPQPAISGSGTRAALLFARGLEAERRGDLSQARRFYSNAAGQCDAAAARNLGRLYNPAYLRQTALGGIDPDSALAREWYERAVVPGDTEARPLLEALSAR